MRYLVFLFVSLLVWGCEEEPPIYNGKPRTSDLIAVGVEEAANGQVWVLCQEVSRWTDVDPIHLDNSPAYDPPYAFTAKTLKLEAGGRHVSSVEHNSVSYGSMVHHFSKVGEGFLMAGVNFATCGAPQESACLPTISVRDEDYEQVRYAQLSCDYRFFLYQDWDDMYISPMRVVELANGNLLFWGIAAGGGLARLTCVTEYGEVMWSREFDSEELHWTSVVSLRNGGFAMVEQYSEIVRFYDDNGIHGHDIEFNRTDEYRVKSIAQLENGNFICGGVNMTSNDPHLWYYNADGTEERDTTLYMEGCQDSVVLYPVGENILLAGFNGEICSDTDPVRLMLIDSAFNVLGVESFGGSAHVVLKDITVVADGVVYLCGAFDRGNGSYSALVTKYDPDLNAVWSTMVHP